MKLAVSLSVTTSIFFRIMILVVLDIPLPLISISLYSLSISSVSTQMKLAVLKHQSAMIFMVIFCLNTRLRASMESRFEPRMESCVETRLNRKFSTLSSILKLRDLPGCPPHSDETYLASDFS